MKIDTGLFVTVQPECTYKNISTEPLHKSAIIL